MKLIFFGLLIISFLLQFTLTDKNSKDQSSINSKQKPETQSTSKTEKKTKKIKKNSQKIDEIQSVMNWAKKHNIYINENLTINKNLNNSHHFYYFTSNSLIKNNTILLKVPYEIMLSKELLDKHYKETKNKKFYNLWEKIDEIKNNFISRYSTKQLLYISIIIDYAINKKKGNIYKKYKPYFDLYEYMDMDHYPIFYNDDEVYYLSVSSFGNELTKAIESLKEEYYVVKNELNFTKIIQDSFLKYRVLTLSNSLFFNNTNNINNQKYEENILIPFIDFFTKIVISKKQNAKYQIKKDTDNNFYLEVITTNDILPNSEIYLKWRRFPNNECLIYYGFVENENNLAPKYFINLFNNAFKKDLGIDMNKEFRDIIWKQQYELNTEFFDPKNIESYRKLSNLFDKYKNKKEGLYEMIADNLQYYLNIYLEQFTDGKINLNIEGEEKRNNIKHIMKVEKLLLEKKLEYVRTVIEDIKEKKNKDL